MPINPTVEKWGSGDMSWLDSRRGVDTARTVTLDASKFTGDADGTVLAGTPVTLAADGRVAPYAGEALAGFILADVNVKHGDESVALLDHGRINVKRLPVEFTVPAAAGAFVFNQEVGE